jgi:hypothetical protein
MNIGPLNEDPRTTWRLTMFSGDIFVLILSEGAAQNIQKAMDNGGSRLIVQEVVGETEAMRFRTGRIESLMTQDLYLKTLKSREKSEANGSQEDPDGSV